MDAAPSETNMHRANMSGFSNEFGFKIFVLIVLDTFPPSKTAPKNSQIEPKIKAYLKLKIPLPKGAPIESHTLFPPLTIPKIKAKGIETYHIVSF